MYSTCTRRSAPRMPSRTCWIARDYAPNDTPVAVELRRALVHASDPRARAAADQRQSQWPAEALTQSFHCFLHSAGRGTESTQVLVHEGNGHAAFANARGHALDRSVADVARGKNAGHARLEKIRIALERPVAVALRDEIGNVPAGADVAPRVADG